MHTFTRIALAAIACCAAPILAQSPVSRDMPAAEPPPAAKPLSKADEARIARCKSLSDDLALKNPTCVALMQKPATPDASGGDDRDIMPGPQPSVMADRLP